MNKVSERERDVERRAFKHLGVKYNYICASGRFAAACALSANWRRYIKNNLLITNARQLRPQRALAGVGNNLLPRFISHPRRAPRCKFGQGGARGARASERHLS